jgi:Amt family ammonium transporter
MVGIVTGVVAGLATITPASGYVGPLGALALGTSGAVVCFFAVDLIKHRWGVDDALDVFAVHGVGGILGSILVAVLAAPALGGVGYGAGNMGAQLVTQLMGVGATVAWSAIATLGLIALVRRTTGLRAHDEAINDGLDLTHHGERAYTP